MSALAAVGRPRPGPALLVVLATLAVGTPAPATDEASARLLDLLQAGRERAGAPPLATTAPLAQVARDRARALAALPHKRRLGHAPPLRDQLHAAGVRYRSAVTHVDTIRGSRDPIAYFARSLLQSGSPALDPTNDGIGVVTLRADDGWWLCVAVFAVGLRLPDAEEVARDTLEAVNRERRSRGLPALRTSRDLVGVARQHSVDMRTRGYFRHEDPEGLSVGDRLRAGDVPYSRAGENLFRSDGIEDPAEDAVRGWLDSPGHRRNMLDPEFRETGIGVEVDERGSVWITQIFMTRVPGR